MMSQKNTFTAIIQHADEGSGAYVEIPFDVEVELKKDKAATTFFDKLFLT